MSQFTPPDQYADPSYGGHVEQKTSKLAVGSLVCSLIFCCPLTTILGILLGIGGFFTVGSNPMLKGRGLAVAGILIGLLATGLQFLGGATVYEKFGKPVMLGPQPALIAGFSGDIAGFKNGFTGAGATAPDAEAAAFIESLRGRYGEFQSCALSPVQNTQPQIGATQQIYDYVLTFSNGTVNAEGEMVFADQQTGQFVMKFSFLSVLAEQGEEIKYPL